MGRCTPCTVSSLSRLSSLEPRSIVTSRLSRGAVGWLDLEHWSINVREFSPRLAPRGTHTRGAVSPEDFDLFLRYHHTGRFLDPIYDLQSYMGHGSWGLRNWLIEIQRCTPFDPQFSSCYRSRESIGSDSQIVHYHGNADTLAGRIGVPPPPFVPLLVAGAGSVPVKTSRTYAVGTERGSSSWCQASISHARRHAPTVQSRQRAVE